MLAGRLIGNGGWVQLSRAEEPEDRHWTVTVVGAERSSIVACSWIDKMYSLLLNVQNY